MFIQSLHYCSCLVYYKIVFNADIEVVPTDICGATPGFVGVLKGVIGVIV